MAIAIKEITTRRGIDVANYALCSFGGAGGQHACLTADALGMKTVFMHPHAGKLSLSSTALMPKECLPESLRSSQACCRRTAWDSQRCAPSKRRWWSSP